ncbi:MAG: ribulose-phosphate 3-epimerase [Clostridia bacterium]|nr:ribulose-phosphate 3-epimerase [Clostridia bacterium]
MIKLSPSLLAADFNCLGSEIQKIYDAGSDMIHLDVMDGIFVPNTSFGVPVIKSLRKNTSIVFDTHLMITDPIRYIDSFSDCGSDIITFHYESCFDKHAVINKIKNNGKKAGISIKPGTDPRVLEEYAKEVDLVLIMSVEPGFGGQKFMPIALEKLKFCRSLIDRVNPGVMLEVDGGITLDNIQAVTEAGADVIVAGSSVFGAKNVTEAVKSFKEY